MTKDEAKDYRGAHRLLGECKRRGWRIALTPSGAWRATAPSGAGLTVAPRPSMRALLAAEAQLVRIEREHHSPTAGTPASSGED